MDFIGEVISASTRNSVWEELQRPVPGSLVTYKGKDGIISLIHNDGPFAGLYDLRFPDGEISCINPKDVIHRNYCLNN